MVDELDDSECSQCPVNSVAEVAGAALCECEEGFFRNDDGSEGIDSDCTGMLNKVGRVFPYTEMGIAVT